MGSGSSRRKAPEAVESPAPPSPEKAALTSLLIPEVLGVPNPIICALPLENGRLQLQMCCHEAQAAVLAWANVAAEKLASENLDLRELQLMCSQADIESIWLCIMFKRQGLSQVALDSAAVTRMRVAASLLLDEDGVATVQSDGTTPVLFAVAGHRKTLAEFLQSAGAVMPEVPPNILATDLLRAAALGDLKNVLMVLAAGRDINAGYTFGWTLLMSAVSGNQPAMVEFLLSLGARRDTVDSSGKRAIDLAMLKGHGQIVKILEDA